MKLSLERAQNNIKVNIKKNIKKNKTHQGYQVKRQPTQVKITNIKDYNLRIFVNQFATGYSQRDDLDKDYKYKNK